MAKSIVTMSIDSHILEIIRTRDINLSGICNEFLRDYLEIEEIEPSELDEMEQEVTTKTAELKALKVHLNLAKKRADKKAKANKAKDEEMQSRTFTPEQLKRM